MNHYNLKCPRCGYIFEAENEGTTGECPLCSGEYNTAEALRLFKETNDTPTQNTPPTEKSPVKIALEWAVFFGSFALFIVLLYFIFSYILGA